MEIEKHMKCDETHMTMIVRKQSVGGVYVNLSRAEMLQMKNPLALANSTEGRAISMPGRSHWTQPGVKL